MIDAAALEHTRYLLPGHNIRPGTRLWAGILRIACLRNGHGQSGRELQNAVDRPAAQQPALRPFHVPQSGDFPDVLYTSTESLVDLRPSVVGFPVARVLRVVGPELAALVYAISYR